MSAYAELTNIESSKLRNSKASCSKYMFSPYLTNKLIADPASFNKKSCVREIKRIKSEVNFADIDLMNFPLVKNNHWVLICINSLFSTLNFFDSAGITSENSQKELVNNLVTNLSTVFKELDVQCKNFQQFKTFNPPTYPSQSIVYDCGVYVMLYIENWNGKLMKDFSNNGCGISNVPFNAQQG